jgi:phage baseplate assembly protein W
MTTFAYPIRVSNGTIVLVSEYTNKVPQVLRHIIQTSYEERVMQPDWGTGLSLFSDTTNVGILLSRLESDVKRGLVSYSSLDIRLTARLGDEGVLSITCYYSVNDTDGQLTINL